MSKVIMVKLQSSDGQMFEVEEPVVQDWKTVRSMIEDTGTDDTIPLMNVNSETLAKVIEYSKYHVEARKSSDQKPAVPEDEIKEWDAQFVIVDLHPVLLDLILAANYLDEANLLDLLTQAVADIIKGKTAEQIRKTFNIVSDFTPEEEEAIRKDNEWAFNNEGT